MKKIILPLILMSFLTCNEDFEKIEEPPEINDSIAKTIDSLISRPYHYTLLDSIHRFFTSKYLWKDRINSLDWKSYTDPGKLLNDYRYSAIDKWSRYMGDIDINAYSGAISTSWPILFQRDNQKNLYVGAVFNQELKGTLKRGMQITHINSNPVTYVNQELRAGATSVEGLLQQNQLKLGLKVYALDDDKERDLTKYETKEVVIQKTTFAQDPVPTYWTKTIDGVTYGYLLHTTFLGTNYGFDNTQKIKQVFEEFQNKNITHLIIDLRYNGGGYGWISSYMASLIIPQSKRKQIVGAYRTSYSSEMSSVRFYGQRLIIEEGKKEETIGEGPLLNLTKVSVLVSDWTASASEILMLNISDAFELNIVGQSATAGKFFGGYFRGVYQHGKPWYYYGLETQAINASGTTREKPFEPHYLIDDEPIYPFDNVNESLIKQVIYPTKNNQPINGLFFQTRSNQDNSILNSQKPLPFTIEKPEDNR